MRPCLSLDNSRNGGLVDAVLLGKGYPAKLRVSWAVDVKYLPHLRFSKAGPARAFSAPNVASALANHIPVVVSDRPGPEVSGVHAGRVIAGVTNQHAFGEAPMCEEIGYPMRPETSSKTKGSSLIGKLSVPVPAHSSYPVPAIVRPRHLHLGPEPFNCLLSPVLGDGMLGVHRMLTPSGVTPRVAANNAGASLCLETPHQYNTIPTRRYSPCA